MTAARLAVLAALAAAGLPEGVTLSEFGGVTVLSIDEAGFEVRGLTNLALPVRSTPAALTRALTRETCSWGAGGYRKRPHLSVKQRQRLDAKCRAAAQERRKRNV